MHAPFLTLRTTRRRSATAVAVLASVGLGSAMLGCGAEPEISVYEAPKEPPGAREVPPFVQMVVDGGAGLPVGPAGHPSAGLAQTNTAGQPADPDDMSSQPVAAGPSIQADWQLPDGWAAITPAPPPAAFAFSLGDPADELTATVTALPGAGGGLLPNLNRWRRQLGLPPLASPDQADLNLIDMLRAAPAANNRTQAPGAVPAVGVDLLSSDGQTRTLAAVWPDPSRNATWFFKLTGTADPVAAAAADFRQFVASTRPLDATPNPAAAPTE